MDTNWIMVVLTLIITFLTFLVLKVYLRIAWLTGSMETHSRGSGDTIHNSYYNDRKVAERIS